MIGIIADQRNRKIIAETAVNEIRLGRSLVKFQLLASLEDLENQFFIVAAALACQVFNGFHAGRLNFLKSEFRIRLFDDGNAVIANFHFCRQDILHAGDRLFDECHRICPFPRESSKLMFPHYSCLRFLPHAALTPAPAGEPVPAFPEPGIHSDNKHSPTIVPF